MDISYNDNTNNSNLLMDAIHEDGYTKIENLLKKGADPNKVYKYGITPFASVVEAGDIDIAELLVKYGAKIDNPRIDGHTELMYVADQSDLTMLDFLLRAGANVNAQDNKGRTALWSAVESGNIDVIQHLIKAGADLHTTNIDEETLLFARIRENEAEVVKLLVSKGLKLDARNHNKESVAYSLLDKTDQFQALIANGLDPNIREQNNNTILMKAIGLRYYPLVKVLLQAGANPNYKENALNRAIIHSNLATIDLLVKHGVDVNQVDDLGSTPLISTVREQKKSIVAYLLSTKKVDINKKDAQGKTALQLAKEKHYTAIVQLLEKSGAK